MEKILKMRNIYKAFPGVVAVDKVDLDLYSGEVLALMGENGAGKSTLIKILSGMYKADKGEIIIGGQSHSEFSTKYAIDLGIGMIYQELNYLNDLTIAENIMLGQIPVSGSMQKVDYNKMYSEAMEIMIKVGLDHRRPWDTVSKLSVAEKQLIEIARAFSRNVKILIMDEPTSALNDKEVNNLFELIEKIKKEGVGIIYVSHRMEEVFEISDRVMVMRDGKHIATKKVKDITTNQIIKYMVGREISDMYPKRESNPGKIALTVENIRTNFLQDISFDVKKGEIVGLFGLMGAGCTELANCIVGAKTPNHGSIKLNGTELIKKSIRQIIETGVSYIPAERKTEGVNVIASVKDNITLSNMDEFTTGRKLNLKKEREIAEQWVKTLNIKTTSVMTEAETLSGGNQQKLVIAKGMNTNPDLLILNEPTRGIDVGAKVEVYNIINDMCIKNKAVLLISSELPEIIALSDRIYVLCEGRLTGEILKKDFSQDILLKYAIGEC